MDAPDQLTMDFDQPTGCGTAVGEGASSITGAGLSSARGHSSQGADGRSEAQRSVDALVSAALRYRGSTDYRRLLQFIRGFRDYAPFNGLLIDVQRPGSSFVAPADRWRRHHRRLVRAGAQPLAILQPFGPIMFVFDVSDTEPLPGAPPLPHRVTHPFEVSGAATPGKVISAIERTVANAVRDGVRVHDVRFGAHLAGQVGWSQRPDVQPFQVQRRPQPVVQDIAVRFDLEVNASQEGLTRYATLCHELAHLYCGHLGTVNDKWWPDRRRQVDHRTAEFEAESVSAMAVWRLDPSADMPPYLHQHLIDGSEVPERMSLERVMQVAGLMIDMAAKNLPLRRPS